MIIQNLTVINIVLYFYSKEISLHGFPDCSCQTNIILDSDCLALGPKATLMGEYEPIGTSLDGRIIYQHTDLQTFSYMYYQQDEQQWLVSSKIGDPKAFIGAHSFQMCADDNDDSEWFVFDGNDFNLDCSLSLTCSSLGSNFSFEAPNGCPMKYDLVLGW